MRLKVWSRETGSAVPSRVSLFILTLRRIWCLLKGFLPLSATASIFLYCQPPPDQSRVYQVKQLRTDGVHCRESVGARLVVVEVVPVTGSAFSGIAMDQFLCASRSSHPLLVQSTFVIRQTVYQHVYGDVACVVLRPRDWLAVRAESSSAPVMPPKMSGVVFGHRESCRTTVTDSGSCPPLLEHEPWMPDRR